MAAEKAQQIAPDAMGNAQAVPARQDDERVNVLLAALEEEKRRLAVLYEYKESLLATLRERDEQMAALRDQLEELRAELASGRYVPREEHDALRATLEEEKHRNASLHDYRQQLLTTLRERDEQMAALRDQLEELRAELASGRYVPREEHDALRATLEEEKHRNASLHDYRQQLLTTLRERDEQMAALRDQLEELRAELASGRYVPQEEQDSLRAALEEEKRRNASLHDYRQQLLTTLRERDEQITALRDQLEGLRAELASGRYVPREEHDALRAALEEEKRRNLTLHENAQELLSTVRHLQEELHKERQRQDVLRQRARGEQAFLDLFGDLLRSDRLAPNRVLMKAFLQRCREVHGEQAVDDFVQQLEQSGYAQILSILLAPEVAAGRLFNMSTLEAFTSFGNGAQELKHYDLNGISLREVNARTIDTRRARYDFLFQEAFLPAQGIGSVCEIGAGWGADTQFLTDRFQPQTYHVYELDQAYAERLEKEYCVQALTCDGETLAATDDASMDLVLALQCLFVMPATKQWSYLREMARVVRPGGIVAVDVMTETTLPPGELASHLRERFPWRGMTVLPEAWLRDALPEERFEFLGASAEREMELRVYRAR